MILFVDYEHASSAGTKWGRELRRLRTEITYRLEDLAHEHCMLVRYDRITDDLLRRVQPTAVFFSGNGSAPEVYDERDLAAVRSLIRARRLPMFGFCGGFQLMATSLGVRLVPVGGAVADDVDPDAANSTPFAAASTTEVGFAPIELLDQHPLLDGLGSSPIVKHAHMYQLATLPDRFRLLASTDLTQIQLAVDDEHRMVGTQFHPEGWTDEHPAGRVMIENFLAWARG